MRLDRRELEYMSLNDIKDTMEELKNCVNCKYFSWEEYEEGVKMYCVYFKKPSLIQGFDYCGSWEM